MGLLLFLIWIGSLGTVYSTHNTCETDQTFFNDIIKRKKAVDVFYFTNDTKKNIQLTWAVENSGVIILVTMTESDSGPGLTSDIYRSENNGKSFVKITDELGERVYIRREHGLQRQQNQKELFLICYDVKNKEGSIIFVTHDGGITWSKSTVPFILSGQLIFHPLLRLSSLILTLEEKSHSLFLSPNSGKAWTKVHDHVVDFFWSIYEIDPEQTFYVLYNPDLNRNETINQTLVKTTDLGRTWIHVMSNVVRVWAPKGIHANITKDITNEPTQFTADNHTVTDRKADRFLYVSHITHSKNRTQQLSVSLDGGKTFRPVYLPTIQSDRFYSVLEVEDDMAFVHVDAPNDTGYGTLFISDSTGQILAESLRHHLYPNHAPVTDFYRVASMRGTYLTTRMNPNRTLYTVISHDRGASWRPLGVPLNVEGACKNDLSSGVTNKQATSVAATSELNATNTPTSLTNLNSHNNYTIGAFDTGNDWSLTDYPASKVCGLQISSQFSIRNRVIASPPLSISAAPGLILAHGHVATHLKNTPADVFVSRDGGYTWYKALDGPHYCQIANRGGLLVAVPADTLWPDVLRFSTDEGRCWHTIPLRSGAYHPDNPTPTSDTVFVRLQSTTVAPNDLQTATMTVGSPVVSTAVPRNATSTDSFVPAPWDETVVFAGLVTEPGGRAMAAAVYGYGTVSQHWRVAIVDFVTNGMVTRSCTDEDYETWIPHSSSDGSTEGCLLGVKQHFKRLKKDALCINEHGMDPLVHTESCLCTSADFECEYGYFRKVGTLECVRNHHVPLFDPCLLPPDERKLSLLLGYRRIPGDQCVGGWHPSFWNQTVAQRLLLCSDRIKTVGHHDGPPGSLIAMSLLIVLIVLVSVGLFCYQRTKQYPRSFFDVPNVQTTSGGIRSIICPWKFKRMDDNHLFTAYHESAWPPAIRSDRWCFNQMDVNSGDPVLVGPKDLRPSLKPCSISPNHNVVPHRSHMRPSFIDRFRNSEPDVTGLIEAEEVALPNEPPEDFDDVCFHDPLAPSRVSGSNNV